MTKYNNIAGELDEIVRRLRSVARDIEGYKNIREKEESELSKLSDEVLCYRLELALRFDHRPSNYDYGEWPVKEEVFIEELVRRGRALDVFVLCRKVFRELEGRK